MGYLDGREPLLDMAYFCLTQVEFKAGGRKRTRRQLAAARYRIDKDVLAMMGTLTSEHGDRWSARKASAAHPLTGSQGAWVEATVKHLIWRLGDTRIGSALPLITMSDLPPL